MKQAQFILALDVDTLDKAKYFINRAYPKIRIFKVGPQLFTGVGPEIIEVIRKKRADTFLDLKFFDIPNTVSNAVRQAVRLGVRMLTLHISGGEEMLKAAVRAVKEEASRMKTKRPSLIGVTVLTSQKASPKKVLKLAKAGLACGLDGVVCSVQEAKLLREKIPKRFLIVTPGIRPVKLARDDQKRTATIKEAVAAGSDFLVIGRTILKAGDPQIALKEICHGARN